MPADIDRGGLHMAHDLVIRNGTLIDGAGRQVFMQGGEPTGAYAGKTLRA